MGKRLIAIVFESVLPARLKPVALACAKFADDNNGTRVYPSIARLARMVGRSTRSVQRAIKELHDRGVLEVLTPARQHQPTHYRLVEATLPFADGDQFRLFPQGFPQARSGNAGHFKDFHRHAQGGVTSVSRRGDTGVTRSIRDLSSTSTHLRARERAQQAHARKTGT